MALRIRRLAPLVAVLGLVGAAVVGLGSLVMLRPGAADASRSPPPPARRARAVTAPAPCVAIIIDDVGRDLELLERLLALELEISYAVLPHAPHTKESLAAIERHGREILLHLPMAPQDARQITDEQVVLAPGGAVEALTRDALAQVPAAVGINNHMGSAASQDATFAARLLSVVRQRGLWFVDSRTTPRSQLCTVARTLEVPCLERDVFLDAVDAPGDRTVRQAITRALDVARRRGWALAIGHPKEATLAGLTEARALKVPLCRVSDVLRVAERVDGT